MRTTVTLDDDVAGEVRRLRRTGIGVSEAVNRLVRAGLVGEGRRGGAYVHRSERLGLRIDVSNVAEVLALLDDER
jgi:Arc/MetJ family transcription regulator